MSRVLRRPMFRGGYVDSEGTGITSGLDTPKRGLVDGPGGYAGELSFGEKFRMAMEQDNANKKAKYDALKSDNSYDLANLFKSNSDNSNKEVVNRSDIALEDVYKPYNLYGDTVRLLTNLNQAGYNYGVRPILNLPKMASNYVFGTEFEQTPEIDLSKKIIEGLSNEEIEKIREAKKKKISKFEKPTGTIYSPEPTEEVVKRKEPPTLEEDIDLYNKLLLDRAGPDKDEYTRQKYLTLAKFGLNLLKPTPAGVKSNLLSNVASAAEKPLEEYGNISMQQSKEDRALRQLATQMAFQKNIPGNIAKGIQDLMRVNPNMTVEEATTIITTGKNKATLEKEERLAIDATRSRLETNPNLKGLVEKDPASLNLFAKLIEKGNVDETQIKGDYDKYNKYVENSYYHNVPNPLTGLREVARYSKGKFYYRGEPGFLIKQTGI